MTMYWLLWSTESYAKKIPAVVLILKAASNERHLRSQNFCPLGLTVNSEAYINVLGTVAKPWIKKLRNGRP